MNRQLIGSALSLLPDTPTPGQISLVAEAALVGWKALHPDDRTSSAELVHELEALCLVWVPSGQILEDLRGHKEWLPGRKSQIEWNFWERYEAYLERRMNWPRQVIRRLDEVTDEVLSRIEDPLRDGAWDRRGLVVGRVQSGKTSTYIGLISKAADAGYRLIIVLAGLHNSLRSQTQVRLDEGFLGFDTQRRLRKEGQTIRMGVGELPGFAALFNVHPLTSSADNGDFNIRVAQTQNVMIGGADPVVLVVKKNKSILANVTRWATTLKQVDDHISGRKVVPNIPLLVIDDESDNASINTAEMSEIPIDENGDRLDEVLPSTINGQIRALLRGFEKKAYVGYTATPFANILSQWNGSTDLHGDDLFPRSFIVNLQPPSNYMSPAKVFGLTRDLTRSQDEIEPLPLVREVDDVDLWMPTRHKRVHDVDELPASLVEAVRGFLLASAARMARGQVPAHNSMLVHVTRFTAVQAQVAELLRDELDRTRRRLRYGDGESPVSLWDELRKLWERDFIPTTAKMPEEGIAVGWDDVRAHLLEVVMPAIVKEVNGTAKDILDYVENADSGLTVIAVGGDKLARGLTLEGLTVSYFLRASRMYDTLMQMGRWFGYRPGYADLCRLYTTPELARWYSQITDANEELTQLFDEMVASRQTPETFGLRVKKSPDGLMVTAPSKMRYSTTVRMSFKNSTPETTVFSLADEDLRKNFEATQSLIRELGPSRGSPISSARPTVVWREVGAEAVVGFLSTYTTHPEAMKANAPALRQFVEARLIEGELIKWTIALASVDGAETRATIGGVDVGLVHRTGKVDGQTVAIGRIVSPVDETIDLTANERQKALARTIESWREADRGTREPSIPVGWTVRAQRSTDRALLLLYPLTIDTQDGEVVVSPVIGFAISFPKTGSDEEIEYAVNQVFWEQQYAWETQT